MGMPNGDRVTETFEGVRQESSRTAPSVRYEVRPGCFLTLFDDGRTRFTIDPVKSGRKVTGTFNNRSNLPGGKMIETGEPTSD
jgi:hypothetical protein